MKVTMKRLEKKCNDYSERWNKKSLWDQYILVQDAWLSGYKTARVDIADKMRDTNGRHGFNYVRNKHLANEKFISLYITHYIEHCGEDKVEVDIISNQIGSDKL